jgi:hypothetical protein
MKHSIFMRALQRWPAFLVASVLTVSALTGCGGNDSKPTTETISSGKSAGLSSIAAAKSVAELQSGQLYRITNGCSEQVLDVSGISQANGAAVHLWGWWAGDNQKWQLTDQGDGTWQVMAKHSGQVLDVAGGSSETGALVIQWPWHGGANQRWQIADTGSGTVSIKAQHSGLMLDAQGAGTSNGTVVWQYPANGSCAQQWKITLANEEPSQDPPANVAPSVSLDTPQDSDNATAGSPLSLTAQASDSDGSVAKVVFYANDKKLGEVTASPWVLSWTPSSAGDYSLSAQATDNQGASTTSKEVKLTVKAAPTSGSGDAGTTGGTAVNSGDSGGGMLADGRISLPLEVRGADGYSVSVNFNAANGQSAKTLWLQANNLSYDAKASIQINTGSWIDLRNDNV